MLVVGQSENRWCHLKIKSARNTFPYPAAAGSSLCLEREHFCLAPPYASRAIPYNDGQLCSLEVIDSSNSKSGSIGQTHSVTGRQHVRLRLRRYICELPRGNYLQIL